MQRSIKSVTLKIIANSHTNNRRAGGFRSLSGQMRTLDRMQSVENVTKVEATFALNIGRDKWRKSMILIEYKCIMVPMEMMVSDRITSKMRLFNGAIFIDDLLHPFDPLPNFDVLRENFFDQGSTTEPKHCFFYFSLVDVKRIKWTNHQDKKQKQKTPRTRILLIDCQ